ncbi:MAG: hypothetical protein AUG44_00650 [Actinobacteria bacterium 13_1_20CM_3_71_11]|nr:MAG: hypothetical protein AUG44_00650 [Actinobacteria bacterium 13_1_20CM_3_71_11]
MGRVPVRRHRLFLALLGVGIALRVLVMLTYRPAIFYIDSLASYLLPLPGLDPTGQDPIGYDVYLLRPLLNVGNITLVVAVQHLLGLGLATAGYALLVHKGARPWLAALAVVPVLLDAYQVQIEHNVMADPLFLALVVAALVALAWPNRPGWPVVLAAGLLFGLAATVRQVGELLVVPLLAYPLIVAAGRGRRRIALAAAGLVCFALPVTAYASYYHQFTGRYGISHAGANALYGRVATFADCTGLDLPAQERILCPGTPRATRPGPDFWAHDPTSPFFELKDTAGDATDRLTQDFVNRIIAHQPVDFAASVGHDAVKVFSWGRVDHSLSDPSVERWRFQIGFPLFEPLVTLDSVGQLSHQYGDGDPVAVTPWTGLLRGYQLTVGYTPGPVLGLALAITLIGVFGRGRARWPALLFLATGMLLVVGGDVVMFSWRYQLPAFALLPVAAVLAVPRRTRPGFPEPADLAALAQLDPDLEFPPVAVLIAAYNEAPALGAVLDAVPGTCRGYPVASLVVVDGATDDTAAVARAHGAVTVEVPVNRGQGAALRLGYHLAAARGARYLVTTDADGQYDVTELPLLLEPLLTGEADFVTGSRGFRAMRVEVATGVTLTQPQYQSSELLIGALSKGYRVVERPLTMHPRGHGRSKKGNNLVYGLRYARVVLGTWWRERKTTRSSTRNRTRNSAA